MFVVYVKSKAVADPGEGPAGGGGSISGHRIDYMAKINQSKPPRPPVVKQ